MAAWQAAAGRRVTVKGKDALNRVVDVEVAPAEQEKLAQAKALDQSAQEELDALKADASSSSVYGRVSAYNEPRHLARLAIFVTLLSGAVQPLFGYLFSDVIFDSSEAIAGLGVNYKK